jgi:hypothetical protein
MADGRGRAGSGCPQLKLRDLTGVPESVDMRYRMLAPIALIVVLVAACTGGSRGGDPRRTPTVTAPVTSPSTSQPTSTSPTRSAPPTTVPTTGPNVRPGEKPPTLPPIGRQHSRFGATEFASYWIEALDWGYATTSANGLQRLFLGQCQVCKNFVDNFRSVAAHRRHFEGGRISIENAVLLHPGPIQNIEAVDLTVSADRLRIVSNAGTTVQRSAAEHLKLRVWVRWTKNDWKVLREAQVVAR